MSVFRAIRRFVNPREVAHAISEPGIGSILPSSAPKRRLSIREGRLGGYRVTVRENGRKREGSTHPTRGAAEGKFWDLFNRLRF